jgi:hypothetical protein
MHRLIFFFLYLVPILGNSQEFAHPLHFANIQPIWNHLIIDSSRLNDEDFARNSYLLSDNYYDFLMIDSFAYLKYYDFYGDIYQGSFIEKVNINTGEKNWSEVFGKQFSGKKELVSSMFINDNGQFEVLSFKDISAETENFYECTFSSRKYDDHSGTIISNEFPVTFSNDDTLKWHFSDNIILPTNNREYIYLEPLTENKNGFPFVRKFFDQELTFISSDTINRSRQYITRYLRRPWRFLDSLIISQRYSTAQKYFDPPDADTYDQYELWIDVFDDEFNQLDSFDMREYMPYNWVFNTTVLDSFIIIHCADSLNISGVDPNIAKVVFDKNFNHVETIDLSHLDLQSLSFDKFPNENGFLILKDTWIPSEQTKVWDIYKTDGEGELNLIHTIKILDDYWQGFGFNKVKISSENTLLVDYWASKKSEDDHLIKVVGIVCFDLEELGIINMQEEVYDKTHLNLKVYPNPTRHILNFEFPNFFSGQIKIYDAAGNIVNILPLENTKMKQLSTAFLNSGTYYIRATSNDEMLLKTSFIKI